MEKVFLAALEMTRRDEPGVMTFQGRRCIVGWMEKGFLAALEMTGRDEPGVDGVPGVDDIHG